jgi:predicted ArsR family transcriptional regulator
MKLLFPIPLAKLRAMDLPVLPDEPLAQPSRARLFAALVELRRPAGTDELAARLELHPNGVRAHLERLREAGLVTRERPRRPRGRPRDMWTVAPDAQPSGDPPSAYVDLARWLARIARPSRITLRGVEATGREIGRELASNGGDASAEQKVHAALVSLGFQPEREIGPEGTTLSYRLRNCPYRDAVRENQRIVCTLHRGLTQGLLDAIAPDTELMAFVPHDPDTAGCIIELRGDLADEGRSRAAAVASD